MKKTVKYTNVTPVIPHNFVSASMTRGTNQWTQELNTNNYFLGELAINSYHNHSNFYIKFFETLLKNRKSKERQIKTYEWKEFLLFLFSTYQKTSKLKLIPRARAQAVRSFIEDFDHNICSLDNLDKTFNLKSKADKIYYLKRDNKEYLLGFLINKKLFITFPYIINHLVDRYVNHFNPSTPDNSRRATYLSNFRTNLYFSLYEKWGIPIKSESTKKTKITMGADPEFLIYSKYKQNPKIADYRDLIHAGNVIASGHSSDELGLDGCTDLGELRPRPSTSPYILTKNIKGLFNKFYSEYGDKYFIETGGGCENSIGGHIHLGHDVFKNFTVAQIKPLMQLLDAFLYYPIKLNMYGAVREWRDFGELNVEIDYIRGECKVDENPEKIIKTIKNVKPLKSQQFANYDIKGQCRSQPHGLEYRSLPSFIGDFTFTKLVFTLAQKIAEKYLDLRTKGVEFTYNDPPQKEDYRIFLKEKEVNQLWEYLHGKKRDLFLKNTLENWKAIKQFFINITDNLQILQPSFQRDNFLSKTEAQLTKKYKPTLLKNNKSLRIHLLASDHYYRSSRFRNVAHPIFIVTRHVNFSTLTQSEISNFMRIPDQNNIYIGLPYKWRDKGYVNKENISRIIGDSINMFSLYNKRKNTFKFDQSISDLKKMPLYNTFLLSQIAEDVRKYREVFKGRKKIKPKKATPRPSITADYQAFVRSVGGTDREAPTTNNIYIGVDAPEPNDEGEA